MNLPATQTALDEQLSKLVPLIGYVIFLVVFAGVAFGALAFYRLVTSSDSSRQTRAQGQLWPPEPQEILRASDHVNDGKHHLLLAATGSVATIKIPNIVDALSRHSNLSIRIVLSESAAKFLQSQSHEQPSLEQIKRIKNVDGIYRDEDEWRKPWVRGDSILHIELRRWADMMAIVPLSANSLAKLAGGLSDSLITSVARAWDATGIIDAARPGVPLPYNGKKGIIVAPAMNTAMWAHPVTGKHIETLSSEWGVQKGGWIELLRPIEKELACGDTGSGAMRDWREVVKTIEERLDLPSLPTETLTNGIAKHG